MKHLHLKSPHYNYLLKSFEEWLTTLGYSDSAINNWPQHVKEFFHWLENHGIAQITQTTAQRTYKFIHYIKERKSQRTGTALSASSVNNVINSINALAKFLNSTGKHVLDITPKRAEQTNLPRNILSVEEIKELYEATFTAYHQSSFPLGQRDRAILALLYGCGLRKQEASNLNVFDIDVYKSLLFVRKGKGARQRYVPIAQKNLQDIKDYIEEGRNFFLMDNTQRARNGKAIRKLHTDDEALLLTITGKRMTEFYNQLSTLKEKAGIDKDFSTHTLRHSIATHLLQSGMKIEDIAKFLGHASLESTQLYTHILNEHTNR